MDVAAWVLLVLTLAGFGVAVWAVRTRTAALGVQRALYEEAARGDRVVVGEEQARAREREDELRGNLTVLARDHVDLQNQFNATLALQQAARDDAMAFQRRLSEREVEVADLKQKIGRDWKGDLHIAVTRERGKGGAGDVRIEGAAGPVRAYREVVPIRGTQTRAQTLIEHPSGDLLRVDMTVKLGADDGDGK